MREPALQHWPAFQNLHRAKSVQPTPKRSCVQCVVAVSKAVLNVGNVFEHDYGALATELERDGLQVALGGILLHQATYSRRTREADFVYVHVWGRHRSATKDTDKPRTLANCRANHSTKARDNVDHTGRELCFLQEPSEEQSGKWRLLCRLHRKIAKLQSRVGRRAT